MVRQAQDGGGPQGEREHAHAGDGDDEEGEAEEVPQFRSPAAAVARPSLPASCARPRCRTPPRGTLRGRDLHADLRAPRRRPG